MMNACVFFLERCLNPEIFQGGKNQSYNKSGLGDPNPFFSPKSLKKILQLRTTSPGGKTTNTQQECRAYTVTMDESRDSCTVEIRRPNGSSFVAKGGGGTAHFWFNFCVAEEKFGCFLKWWYPTTISFPTKTDHFGVFWGYHHLRKHPNRLW